MKKFGYILLALVIIGISALLIGDDALAGGPAPDKNSYSDCNQDKIEYGLWTILGRPTTLGTAFGGQQNHGVSWGNKPFIGFAIRFDDAVYDHCAQIEDRNERYRCKADAIDEDQAAVRAYLDSQGVEYRALHIVNKIWVDDGDRDMVCDLSNYDEVVYMYPNYFLAKNERSHIYDINASTREIQIEIFLIFDYHRIWLPVAEDAIINVPDVHGRAGFDDLSNGQYIYYVVNDNPFSDWVITRIIVLQDIPEGNH
jgi:hypothetical protein